MTKIKAYRYYKSGMDPFKSIIEIPEDQIDSDYWVKHKTDNIFEYINHRKVCETFVRNRFIKKGGKPKLIHPIYFLVNNKTIYKKRCTNSLLLTLDIEELDKSVISFTDGCVVTLFDRDDKTVYCYDEFKRKLINNEFKYQIEMQLWDIEGIKIVKEDE